MHRRRLVRVPASSANLGPGFDVLAAALALHLELEVEETGRVRASRPTSRSRATARNLCVRAFERAAPGRRLHVPDQLRDPAGGRARLQRGGDRRRRWWPPTTCSSSTPTCSRSRPSSRGIPTTSPRRCAAASCLRRRRGDALRAAGRARGVAGRRPHEPVRTQAARAALPAEVPMADAVFNVAHASLLVLGLARGDWDLVARGLADRLHQPRRAHAVPALDRAGRTRARARRARRDDLRRRADRARVVALRADGRASRRRCSARPRAGPPSCARRSSRRAPTCARCRSPPRCSGPSRAARLRARARAGAGASLTRRIAVGGVVRERLGRGARAEPPRRGPRGCGRPR